jgi:two-component system, LuxR family, response regulator FixJ
VLPWSIGHGNQVPGAADWKMYVAENLTGTMRRSVFIVDDDESVGFGLTMLLKANGYIARSFISAERFLSEAVAADWNCGLIDVQMPGMDGLTLAEQLHAEGAPPPELLMMTGRVTQEVEQRAAAITVTKVLSKPLDPAEVVAAIRLAIAV